MIIKPKDPSSQLAYRKVKTGSLYIIVESIEMSVDGKHVTR